MPAAYTLAAPSSCIVGRAANKTTASLLKISKWTAETLMPFRHFFLRGTDLTLQKSDFHWHLCCGRISTRMRESTSLTSSQQHLRRWKTSKYALYVASKVGNPSSDCVLAVDVGTGGTKAALLSQSGEVLATGFTPHTSTVTSSSEGAAMVEQEPQEWWLASLAAMDFCLSRFSDKKMVTVRAVAVTGQMQDVILVPAGAGVEPPRAILYSDTRAAFEAEEVAELGGGAERVAAVTGTAQGAASLLAKLRWLDRHEQGASEQCSHILFGGHDYVVYRMCGRHCTDATTASTTGLSLCDSPGEYAEDLMREVGLGSWLSKLPPMVPPDVPCGIMSEEAAIAIGRPELKGIPVFHSCGDAGATTIGCGAGVPGPLYAYLGTSGWVGASVPRPSRDGRAANSGEAGSASVPGVFTLAHPDPALIFRTGSIMTAGGNLKWALSLLNDDTSTSVLTPKDADELAGHVPAGAGGLLYLPYLNGERCPFDDSNARGAFIGLSPSTTKGAMLRAVMEGVAFALKDAELAMAASSPVTNDGNSRLRMVGGGARSSLWPTILGGVFNRPIDVLADAQEVGVKGAAILAGRWLGWHSNLAPGGEWLKLEREYKGTEGDISKYKHMYSVYSRAYPILRETFAGVANL